MIANRNTLNRVGSWVAAGIMMQVTAMLFIVAFIPIPHGNEQLFNQICTNLLAVDLMMVSFFYGTSVGSRAKDDALATQAQALQAAAPDTMTLNPGDQATATTSNTGTTTIHKDTP